MNGGLAEPAQIKPRLRRPRPFAEQRLARAQHGKNSHADNNCCGDVAR